MKKCPTSATSAVAVTLMVLAMQATQAASVFVLDWASAPTETRFYTTFDAGGDLPAGTAATNSNASGGNPGPGFVYVPTGIAWQPDTVYTVDLQVYDRGAFPGDNDARFEFGLWAGLPADDVGSGNYGSQIGPGEPLGTLANAMTLSAIGIEGDAQMTDAQVPNGSGSNVLASQLIGATVASFTTGSDVSGLGDMVVFLRNADQDGNNTTATNPQATDTRAHWNFLTVDAVPVPEPSSALMVFSAMGLGIVRRRRR